MSKIIKRFSEGERIPDGARYLYSKSERGHVVNRETRTTWQFLFWEGYQTRTTYAEYAYHYYELDEPTEALARLGEGE